MTRKNQTVANGVRAKLKRRALLFALAAAPLGAAVVSMSNSQELKKEMEGSLTRADDGAMVHFSTIGEGAPLVLLHGFSDRIESWAEFGYVNALTAVGRRLVMIDQRGHGRASALHDIDAYAPRLRAGDVAAVLDALGIKRADVLGYSMGAGRRSMWRAFIRSESIV